MCHKYTNAASYQTYIFVEQTQFAKEIKNHKIVASY